MPLRAHYIDGHYYTSSRGFPRHPTRNWISHWYASLISHEIQTQYRNRYSSYLITSISSEDSSSSESMPPTKADDLLAFRSIITMLSHIQSNGRSSTDSEARLIATRTADDSSYKELRLLDALSTVLTRQHEVIAVVALPYCGSDDGGSESNHKVRVFASVVNPSNANF